MRTAAGILMMIGVVLGITMINAAYGSIPGILGWLKWFWFCGVFCGAIYTLKRKSWGICLASSILLLPMGTVLPILLWVDADMETITPFAVVITIFYFVIGVLPLVFVLLRKRDWE